MRIKASGLLGGDGNLTDRVVVEDIRIMIVTMFEYKDHQCPGPELHPVKSWVLYTLAFLLQRGGTFSSYCSYTIQQD